MFALFSKKVPLRRKPSAVLFYYNIKKMARKKDLPTNECALFN
jgi:hypothetical protein